MAELGDQSSNPVQAVPENEKPMDTQFEPQHENQILSPNQADLPQEPRTAEPLPEPSSSDPFPEPSSSNAFLEPSSSDPKPELALLETIPQSTEPELQTHAQESHSKCSAPLLPKEPQLFQPETESQSPDHPPPAPLTETEPPLSCSSDPEDYPEPRTPEEPYPEDFQPRTPDEPYPESEQPAEPETDSAPVTNTSTNKCFFCPEISTRGRKVKRTKIHLQLQSPEKENGCSSGPGPSRSTTSTPNSRLESEEFEATQGFHQLCHILSIETKYFFYDLEIDYFLACAQCTQHLISLNNFIGVFTKVREEISESVDRFCKGILELGVNQDNGVNGDIVEDKINWFRKSFELNGSEPSSSDNTLESELTNFKLHAPIDWGALTKEALSSRGLYHPIGFLPLSLSDSVIKVEPGIESYNCGQDGEWSDPDALFHCQTKLEPEDYDNFDENLEYAPIVPPIETKSTRRQRHRQLRAKHFKARRSRQTNSLPLIPKSEPTEPPACNECGKTFSRISGLTYHLRSVHNIGEPLQRNHECKVCGKTFIKPSHLTEHSRSHTGEKMHQCRHCEQRFRGTTGRKAHEESVHGIRDPSFLDACPKCPDVKFTSSVQYRAHQRRVHPEDVYGIKVDGDGNLVTDPSQSTWGLRVRQQRDSLFTVKDEGSDGEEGFHLNSASDDEPYHPKRKRSRASTPRKARTRKRATDPNAPPGSEDPAASTSDAPPKRKRQRKKKSDGEAADSESTPKEKKPRVRKPKVKPPPLPPILKPRVRPPAPLKLKCNYCDRMCAYESDRIRHENSIHLNIKPYLCESCGKGFNRIYQLRIHMESHANQESGPKECPHCPGKIFKNQGFLTIHLVKMHNHEKKPQKPPVVYV